MNVPSERTMEGGAAQVRENAGYVITQSIRIGNAEFVLGENKARPQWYVTWECRGGIDYFWGHYTSDKLAALEDLLQRAQTEVSIQMQQRKQREKSAKEGHAR